MKSIEEYCQRIRDDLNEEKLNLYTASMKMLGIKIAIGYFNERGIDLEKQVDFDQINEALRILEEDTETDQSKIERSKAAIHDYMEFAKSI